ncbi:PREDICTED: probable serine/threonine-protein kinase DDB_G0282963 [Papilio xuthus]|uniref:Probable serine/threonine-protein kinase DDB_G0282963 n=1 Tax=Papilio xuthus TaxID=66420 RepID=A0AAJ6Z5M7_PAPXU|nr:PREDICTED: probable serine/threonine-protein kinase DDB_G0282963 [Papilio xuthus]
MTENGNRSPPSWDMPGPSSLAAILDTVFTSSSDNQPRNEEMDCEPLFAESDDDVEVLPSVPNQFSLPRNESSSKNAVSSDFVNSTSPAQSYVVNIPLSHLGSSHTPVPEEYQPLPDSSSSLDYVLRNNNADSTNANGQRFADVNIRYQPKQFTPVQDFHYPHYRQYGQNSEQRESRDYMPNSFASNRLPQNEASGYSNQPINYTVHSTPPQLRENINRGFDDMPPNNVYNHISLPDNNYGDSNLLSNLERPSRKLNISPRRRLSKENEVNSNLIEVSSEEEDNVAGPRKRQCDNGAGRSDSNVRMDVSTNTNEINANIISRVEIKREPMERTQAPTQARGDAQAVRRPNEITIGTRNNVNTIHIRATFKRNDNYRPNAPRVTAAVVSPVIRHPGNQTCRERNCGNDCTWNNQNNANPNRSHHHYYHHHHHHHHHRVLKCTCNLPISRNSNPANVKEEPGQSNQASVVKPEPGASQATRHDENQPLPAVNIKLETTNQQVIKIEPGCSNQLRNMDENRNVIVKIEANTNDNSTRRCCIVDAGGDRKVKGISPQPGPSVRRGNDNEIVNANQNQQPQPINAAARRPDNPGLSAPDLQLDWFTDSSDDDVQVLGEENNQQEVIDLTSSPSASAPPESPVHASPTLEPQPPQAGAQTEPQAEPQAEPLAEPQAQPTEQPQPQAAQPNCRTAGRVPAGPRVYEAPRVGEPQIYHPNSHVPHHSFVRTRVRVGTCMVPCPTCCCAPNVPSTHATPPMAHLGERRRSSLPIAPPYIMHERLWHRQHHMLEVQRRSMIGELAGSLNVPPPYPPAYTPTPRSTTYLSVSVTYSELLINH